MAYHQVSTMSVPGRLRIGRWLLALLLGSHLALAADVDIRADSPTRYTVSQGDTLWDIAGKFLEEPWLWPQVWQINPQIENPDLIYPGDVIELAYENGAPVLRLSRSNSPAERTTTAAVRSSSLPTIRLSPEVRREAVLSPIPAIPMERISAFLSDNYVIAQSEFDAAPYILAEGDGHALIAAGNEVFARGNWADTVLAYAVVRRGRDLVDPDTGKLIGVEALALGAAQLHSVNGDRGVLRVTTSNLEIKPGDRLIPRQNIVMSSRYLPTPPDFDVDAAIVSIGTGRQIGGIHDSLIINVGDAHGITAGHVLAVREPPEIVRDTQGQTSVWQAFKRAFGRDSGDRLEFPGKEVATVLVYRVFDDTSLALVLRSSSAIRLNDRVVTP
jgi:hypothetical protein